MSRGYHTVTLFLYDLKKHPHSHLIIHALSAIFFFVLQLLFPSVKMHFNSGHSSINAAARKLIVLVHDKIKNYTRPASNPSMYSLRV